MIQLRGEKEEDEENVPNHTFAVLMHSILERSAEEDDDDEKVLKREEFHTWETEVSLPLSPLSWLRPVVPSGDGDDDILRNFSARDIKNPVSRNLFSVFGVTG